MCFLKPTGLGFNVDANILGLLEDLSAENNFLGASGKERHLGGGMFGFAELWIRLDN